MNPHLKKLALAGAIVCSASGAALAQTLAATPPMGWNSWNHFGCTDAITEDLYKTTADAIVSSGMKDAGYVYLNIDDCWHGTRNASTGMISASSKFTGNSLKSLSDYVHSKGLKFGVYTCAGARTCAGQPGSLGFEDKDIQQYTAWGVDYVKVDWCSVTLDQNKDPLSAYKKFSKAIKDNGNKIVLSICNWGQLNPWIWGRDAGGQLWRTTADIKENWTSIVNIIDLNANLYRYSAPGGWNDPDMLEVGNGQLTLEENKAHFGMWCLLASPLIAGNDIRTMSPTHKAILTNKEAIEVNQDPLGLQAQRVAKNGDLEVWARPLLGGHRAVGLFNRSGATATLTVNWSDLNKWSAYPWDAGKAVTVRDLWEHKDLKTGVAGAFQMSVPSHGLAMLKLIDPNGSAVRPILAGGKGVSMGPNFVRIDLPGTHALKVLDLEGRTLWSTVGDKPGRYPLPGGLGSDAVRILQVSAPGYKAAVKY